MIVDVPYLHWATVQRPRRRTPDRDMFVSVHMGEVREVASSQAPVAMWWVSPSFGGRDGEHSRQVAVRNFEGRLYEPLRNDGAPASLDDERLATAARRHKGKGKEGWKPALLDQDVLRASLMSRDTFERKSATTVDEEARKRTVFLESDAGTGARKVADTLGRLLLVEGVAYRDVGRPMYRLDERSYFAVNPAHAIVPALDWVDLRRPEDYGRVAKEIKSSRRGHDASSLRNLQPDVVDPALLDFDSERWLTMGCANAVLREMAKSSRPYDGGSTRLASYGRDVILSYGRLRDAVAADADTSALGTRLGEFAEACAPHGTLREEERAARAGAERVAAEADEASSYMAGI